MDLKEYRKKLIGNEQERAVSPVIGVILMVAVTVILAAVIATMVMGIGDDLGDTSATVSTDVNTNSDWLPNADAGPQDENDNNIYAEDIELAYIGHNSGDTIEEDDLRVVVRGEDGNSLAVLEASEGWADSGFGIVAGEDFNTGTTYTLEADTNSDLWESDEPTEDEITIQLIEISSESSVGESTVAVPDNTED